MKIVENHVLKCFLLRASELRFAIYVVTSHRRTEDSEKKLEMPTNLEILAYF